MPVEFELMYGERVVLATYRGVISADELCHTLSQFRTICNKAKYPVHSITDASNIIRLPANTIDILMRPATTPFHGPNVGTFIVINPTSIAHKIVGAVSHLIPLLDMKIVPTLEQAYAEVEQLLKDNPDSS